MDLLTLGCLLSCLASPVTLEAPDLTVAEEAAFTGRAMTPSERQLWENECKLDAEFDTDFAIVALSEKYFGPVVHLPAVRMLQTNLVGYEGPALDTYKVMFWPELPYGGIAKFDSCSTMKLSELRPVTDANQPILRSGFRLRATVDLASDYPTAVEQMREYHQVVSTAASKFVAIRTDDPTAFESWITENIDTLDGVRSDHPAITIGDTVYVPID